MKKAIRINKAWLKSDTIVYSLQKGLIKISREEVDAKTQKALDGKSEALKELNNFKEKKDQKSF